jgi:hypothetical protein
MANFSMGYKDAKVVMNGQTLRDSDEIANIEFRKDPVDGLPHIRFLFTGEEHLCVPDYVVNENFKERFPRQWAAFEAGEDQHAGQTHLRDVTWLDEVARQHLYSKHIFTVETLANITDTGLTGIGMQGRKFRDRAQGHMQSAEKASAFDQVTALLSEKDQKLIELTARLDALENPKKEAAKARTA